MAPASLGEAVDRIDPGSSVVAGVALEHAIPFAVGHELVRQGTDGLTLVGPISDALFDQLVGAGLVSRVRAAWVGNVSVGSGYRFREAVETGEVAVENHSNLSLALGLQAAALGVPSLSTRSLLGSDLLPEGPFRVDSDPPDRGSHPGDPGPVVSVPAVDPDWAVVHAQRGSPEGDLEFRGNAGVLGPAVGAADDVLATVEEVVPAGALDPDRVAVTREQTTVVAECPYGAHPSPLLGCYRRDHDRFLEYGRRTETRAGFEEWADDWIHGVDREEYVDRIDADLDPAPRGSGSDPAARDAGPAPGPRESGPDPAARDAEPDPTSPGPAGGSGDRSDPGSDPEAGRPEAGEYTPRELMVAAAAREIRDGEVAFVGMRLPLLAFQLASATHAPDAVAVYESGVVRGDPADEFVHTMCDLPHQRGALATTDMLDVMGRLARGDVDVGFLGTAEVDRRGNLNTTRVSADGERIRLPGSGGACDIACLAGRTVVLMPHEPRRFVESVEYVTSPGHGRGAADPGPGHGRGDGDALSGRDDAGGRPAPGGGPDALVTSKATFGFDGGEMYLRTTHPGVDVEEVRADVPWDLPTAREATGDPVGTTDPPTAGDLALVRRFDPEGFWTS